MPYSRFLFVPALMAFAAAPAAAQTDYYNTDRHRPLRIEDAYPAERYSFDFHVAPVRFERHGPGFHDWTIEPELAYGILPRTHLEIGAPFRWSDTPLGGTAGLAGVELSLLHALNIETASVPALGLRATAALPAGPFGPDEVLPSLQANVTRTFRWLRVHTNFEYTFAGEEECDPAAACDAVDHPQWLAGIAIDKTFPLRSVLVGAEVFATRPMNTSELGWTAGFGARYQLDPLWALDGGVGIRLGEDDRYPWYLTAGVARVFALRSLLPRRRIR